MIIFQIITHYFGLVMNRNKGKLARGHPKNVALPLKTVSLPHTTTILQQLGAEHYGSYNNISTSKRYEYSYKRQVYTCLFTSTFEQYKRANITGFSLDISACRSQIHHKYKIAGFSHIQLWNSPLEYSMVKEKGLRGPANQKTCLSHI